MLKNSIPILAAVILNSIFTLESCTQKRQEQRAGSMDVLAYKVLLEGESSVIRYSVRDENKYITTVLRHIGPSESGNTDTISFNELKNKIILRFTELNCEVCVDNTIKKLKELADKIGYSNIVIFASYKRPIYYQEWKKVNDINFKTYNISRDSGLNLESEAVDRPYIFYVDHNCQVRNIFFPFKEDNERSTIYLNELARKYYTK
jgi:hypothetical protein